MDLEQGEEVDFLPAAAPGLLLLIGLDASSRCGAASVMYDAPAHAMDLSNTLPQNSKLSSRCWCDGARTHTQHRKKKQNAKFTCLPMLPPVNNKRGIHDDDDDDDGALMDVAGRRRQ